MTLLSATIAGLQAGAIYAIVAIGLIVVYATTRVFNLAHGALVMVGAVLGVLLWDSLSVPVVLALAIAVTAGALLGGLTELIAVRPIAGKGESATWLLSTLGVAIIIETIFLLVVTRKPGSSATRAFPSFWPAPATWDIGALTVVPAQLFMIPVALGIAGVVWLLLRLTSLGRAMGAVADDPEAAALRGIPVAWITSASFILGGAIAGLGGFLAGPVTEATVGGGLVVVISGFTAAVIGGLPELRGALVGGAVLGLAEQYTVAYLDARLQSVVALVVLLLVLMLRPQGIFGKTLRTV